jgi:hypothetical protein
MLFWDDGSSETYSDIYNKTIEFESKNEAREKINQLLKVNSTIFSAKIFRINKDEVEHIDNEHPYKK